MSRTMITGTVAGTLLAFGMTASSHEDAIPEPGGIHGGPYIPWGMPPFVEHETPPPPGGAFEGRKLESTEETESAS